MKKVLEFYAFKIVGTDNFIVENFSYHSGVSTYSYTNDVNCAKISRSVCYDLEDVEYTLKRMSKECRKELKAIKVKEFIRHEFEEVEIND